LLGMAEGSKTRNQPTSNTDAPARGRTVLDIDQSRLVDAHAMRGA
jgi:hypothetical protein